MQPSQTYSTLPTYLGTDYHVQRKFLGTIKRVPLFKFKTSLILGPS